MKYFKIKHEDGRQEIIKAKTMLEVIKQYDNDPYIAELSGEQLAIAISNED